MSIFTIGRPSGRVAVLERELRAATIELDAAKATIRQQTAENWNLTQKLEAAKHPIPTQLSDITAALHAYLPSINVAPGYATLAKANDADSYAQGLHLLMQHARLVGFQEGKTK